MRWALIIKDDKGKKILVRPPKPTSPVCESDFYTALAAVTADVLRQYGASVSVGPHASPVKPTESQPSLKS
jgi:hypothetical protein